MDNAQKSMDIQHQVRNNATELNDFLRGMKSWQQEMQAKVQEMKAKVVEAESEVPKAMSQAFREGNLGIFDYYNINNIKADTGMRDSIADTSAPKKDHSEDSDHD